MTNYSRADYGPNPLAGVDANADHGWGGFEWPDGVPDHLLGVAQVGDVKIICRTELVELFQLFVQLANAHNYTIFANHDGEDWGPWSYENRQITGGVGPSNHSRGRAVDINSPWNPQSFVFESTIPPELVAAYESVGFYWGGRYGGGVKFDTMHFEYAFAPGDVPGHVAKAEELLAAGDWLDNASEEEVLALIAEAVR